MTAQLLVGSATALTTQTAIYGALNNTGTLFAVSTAFKTVNGCLMFSEDFKLSFSLLVGIKHCSFRV